jgi:pilus assembly protein CpaD
MTRTSKEARRVAAIRTGLIGLAALVALTGGLGGCSRLDDLTAVELSEPPRRHPIAYTPHTEALLVELPPGAGGLSASQEADVWRFVDRYRKEGTGRLQIAAPRSAGGHLAASRSVRHVEEIALEAGIDPDAIVVGRYHGSTRVGPAVKLAYERPVALPPQCRDWSTDLGENRERLPYNDFGCATQRNLALTVANSRDLQIAQEETPRSSERRSATWDDYKGTGATGGSAGPAAGSGAAPAGGAAPAAP